MSKFNVGDTVMGNKGNLKGIVALVSNVTSYGVGSSVITVNANSMWYMEKEEDFDLIAPYPNFITFNGTSVAYNYSKNASYGSMGLGQEMLGIVTLECPHEFVSYTGLTEIYEYCKKCDQKR